MLTAAVLCLSMSLGATPPPSKGNDQPVAQTLEPVAAAPTDTVSFDALPPVPQIADDVRVKRFLGALSGGVVGLAASLALMPLGDSTCFGGPCVSFVHGLVGTFAPLFALGGAWLGFTLMGGDGGLATPAIALAPALLIGLGLLNVAREVDASTVLSLMPYLITAGVFLAGGAALALDLRARQLSRLGGAAGWGMASAGRVVVTALVAMLTAGGAVGFSTLLAAASGFSFLAPVMAIVGAAVGSLGVAAAVWGVHKGMNGRGSFLSALSGLGIGWLVTLAGAGLFAATQGGFTFDPVRNTAATVMLVQLGAASAILGPVLALEWSHTNAVEASLPAFSFSASPTPQGGMVAAGMRF